MRQLILLSSFILTFSFLTAQPPKREMRAGWLATVARIDWPTTLMTTVNAQNIAKQKAEFTAILDSVVAANMNAVFFQIRPETDALYDSAYEPWSEYLTGTRGLYPGYDPLAFAIEESHKRGIELHAWLNPYRYERTVNKNTGKPGDYRTPHPEWILNYSDVAILDPGNPAVRRLIKSVVGDILSKYDLDGLIFDDYFYAYSGTSTTLDNYSQNLYKPANKTLSDWRRENVNKMIADVFDTIQAVKPQVIFGVSPFGIWTTSNTVATARGLTLPTGITGSNMYEQIYCDPVAWLEQGKVDYISPQLYWTTTSTGQDYKKLCPWWSDVAAKYSRYFYSSMSLTNLVSAYKAPQYAPEVPWSDVPADLHEAKLYTRNGGLVSGLSKTEQRIIAATNFDDAEVGLEIDWNRNSTKNQAPGSVFFSIKNLWTKGKFTKYLREQKFTTPALTPAVSWKSHTRLTDPQHISVNGNLLIWDHPQQDIRFSIYAVPNQQVGSPAAFTDAQNLLGVSYDNQFDLTKHISLMSSHQFAVATLDRYGNEITPVYVTTSNISPVVNSQIRIFNNTLQVVTDQESLIELYSIGGILIDKAQISGTYSRSLKSGVYIVRINGKITKIIIYQFSTHPKFNLFCRDMHFLCIQLTI